MKSRYLAIMLAIILFIPPAVYAQETDEPAAVHAAGNGASMKLSDVLTWPDAIRVRGDNRSQTELRIVPPLYTLPVRMPAESRGPGVSGQQAPQSSRERSTRRKIFGGIVGGVGGFFGGMFLGAAIEGHRCNCDDPGLVGALIGAPVGGVAGGILGYKFLF